MCHQNQNPKELGLVMAKPITINVNQAQLLAEHGSFVVEGDWDCPQNCYIVPPEVWAAADQPCPTCGGTGAAPHADDLDDLDVAGKYGVDDHDCPDCHGTGRTVIELVTSGNIDRPPAYISGELSLGLFTVEVLPIVASDDWVDGVPCVEANPYGEFWKHPTSGIEAAGLILPDARPGQYAIIATKVET